MVSYWLCITNEENWKVIKNTHIWGVSDRHRKKIERVRIGDFMIFYIKPVKIGGIFKVISEPFESGKALFTWQGVSGQEVFPYRVKIKPVILPQEPIEFRPLIQKLRFIRNKRLWVGHILGKTMRLIPKEDYELIKSALLKIN